MNHELYVECIDASIQALALAHNRLSVCVDYLMDSCELEWQLDGFAL